MLAALAFVVPLVGAAALPVMAEPRDRDGGIGAPNVAFLLAARPAVATAGQRVEVDVSLQNVGNGSAAVVDVLVGIPPFFGYEGDDAPEAGLEVWGPGQWRLYAFAPGAVAFRFWGFLDPAVPDQTLVAFDGWVTYTDATGAPMGSVPAKTEVTALVPVLAVSMTAAADAAEGQLVSFAIALDNVGSAPAMSVWLNDLLPYGFAYAWDTAGSDLGGAKHPERLEWTFWNLPPGSHGFTLAAVVMPGTVGQILENTVRVLYANDQGILYGPVAASAAVTVVGSVLPTLSLDVAPAAADLVPSQALAVQVGLRPGGGSVPRAVQLELGLPPTVAFEGAALPPTRAEPGLVVWSLGDVPAELTVGVDLRVSADVADLGSDVLRVTAWFQDEWGVLQPPAETEALVAFHRVAPSLAVTVDAVDASPGDVLTYQLTLANTGSADAITADARLSLPAGTLVETIPAASFDGTEVTWALAGLAAGTSQALVARVAAGTGDDLAVLRADARASLADAVGNVADVTAAPVESLLHVPRLSFGLAMPISTSPGDIVVARATLTNVGSSVARQVAVDATIAGASLADATPPATPALGGASWVLGDLDPGQSIALELRLSAGIGDLVSLDLRAVAADGAGNPYEETAAASAAIGQPSFVLTPTPSEVLAPVGQAAALTWHLENVGDGPAAAVTVTLHLPPDVDVAGTTPPALTSELGVVWSLGAVAPGAAVDLVVWLVPARTLADEQSLAVDAVLSFAFGTAGAGETAASALVRAARPHLILDAWRDLPQARPGDLVTVTVNVVNDGSVAAAEGALTTTPPSDLTFVSSSLPFSAERGTVTWALPGIAAGEFLQVRATFAVGAFAPRGGTRVMTFAVRYADDGGLQFAGSVALVPIAIAPRPAMPRLQLRVAWSAAETAPGASVELTVVVKNEGGGAASDVRVLVTLPPAARCCGGPPVTFVGSGAWMIPLGRIASGTAERRLVVTLPSSYPAASLDAVAEVSYNDDEGRAMSSLRGVTSLAVVHPIDPVPVLLPVTLLAVPAAAGAAAFAAREDFRVWLLKFLAIPLYTRLRREQVLEHEVRGMIRGYILANPGDHFNAIRAALGLTNGTLAYHLSVLEKQRIVKSMKDGKYRRFFPMAMRLPMEGEFPTKMQKAVLALVDETPGITQKEIARYLGVTQPTVSYHIDKLQQLGYLTAARQGMTKRYTIGPRRLMVPPEARAGPEPAGA